MADNGACNILSPEGLQQALETLSRRLDETNARCTALELVIAAVVAPLRNRRVLGSDFLDALDTLRIASTNHGNGLHAALADIIGRMEKAGGPARPKPKRKPKLTIVKGDTP